jgi:hypothetical protein
MFDARVADQPLRDDFRIDVRVRGERARDEQSGHANAKAATEKLQQEKASWPVELGPI